MSRQQRYNAEELRELLASPSPTDARQKFIFNNRVRDIPVKGDIIMVEKDGVEVEYLLVTNVSFDSTKNSWYRGYRLASTTQIMDKRRPDFVLQEPLKGIIVYPKKQSGIDIRVLDNEEGFYPFEETQLIKGEAGYISPPPEKLWPQEGKGIRCGTCIYYNEPGYCDIVRGEIHKQGCCNLWSCEGRPDIEKTLRGEDIEDILEENPHW